ncbi:hypothetical protein AAVH_35884, partial [Aphelenchoides avenae]
MIAEHDARSNRIYPQVPPLADASAPTAAEYRRTEAAEPQPLPHTFATAPAQADIEGDDIQEIQTVDEYVDASDAIGHASWNWEDAQNAFRRFPDHIAKTLLNANFLLAEYVAMTFLYTISISLATTAVYAPTYAWEGVICFANNAAIPLLRFVKDAAVFFAVHIVDPLLQIALELVVIVLSLPIVLAVIVIVTLLERIMP